MTSLMSFVVPLFHHEASEYLKLVWITAKNIFYGLPGEFHFAQAVFREQCIFLDRLIILVSSGKTDVFILNVYQLSSPKLWPQMIWPHMVRNTPLQTMPNRSMKFLYINSSCVMMTKLYRIHCIPAMCPAGFHLCKKISQREKPR